FKMKLWIPLLVVIVIQLTTALVAPEIEDTLDIIHDVDHVVNIVRSKIVNWDAEIGDDQDKRKMMLKQVKDIDQQIFQVLLQSSHDDSNVMESISDFIDDDAVTKLQLNELIERLNKISMRFDQIIEYERRKETLEENTLISFAEWVVLPSAESVEYSMERVHLKLFGPINNKTDVKSTSHTLLSRIMKGYEKSSQQRCSILLSPQQLLYSLYTEIAIIELKGYILMEFALKKMRVSGLGNFTDEADLFRQSHTRRNQHALNVLRIQMQQADRSLWRCDPPTHIAKVTYDEVTRLLQGYIENEDGLNADRTCRRTCGDYQTTRVSGCIHDSFCSNQPPCTGRVHDCRFIASKMWVCQSPQSSSRRYEYIEYEDGQLFGHRTSCGRGTNTVDSWRRWIFWHCHFCFCLCDEQGVKSDRYFNLRETLADVASNKVVTGVRFVKKNRIFHLQIQQGQLLPRGGINVSTVEWKPVDDYHIHHPNVREGVDFHTLSYGSRGIDLTKVMKTNDTTFVVTGVRFRLYRGRLNLRLRYSKFDFVNGKLNESVWESNEQANERLNLKDKDLPTNSRESSKPLSADHHYLEFVNSGLYADAAQTTVPFVDIQEVSSSRPVPLHGIGIYYKSSSGYGGFVAPKIIHYDFSPHVKMPLTF
ncbi:hypothetical protein KR093_009160, partial [Drosophila rubida]